MNITLETINILFFMIPGLCASFIIDTIIVRKDLTAISRIIEALIFTFLIYVFLSFITNIELFATLKLIDGEISLKFTDDKIFLLSLIILTIVLPIIVGKVMFSDWHMRVLRTLKITDKTSRDTTWQDVLIEQKRNIVIHLRDERRIYGWPMYYSNLPENGFIYLWNPSWIDMENKYIECNTHGILIKSDDIYFVEFLLDQEGTDNSKNKK